LRNALIIALVVAIAAGGYYWYQDKDTRYARQVMDCMYAGSLDPIKDTLNPEAQKALDNPQLKMLFSQSGPQLKKYYGEIGKMERKSEGPVEGPLAKAFSTDTTQKTWTATSDKGTFDVTLYFDKDAKLLTVTQGTLKPLQSPK